MQKIEFHCPFKFTASKTYPQMSLTLTVSENYITITNDEDYSIIVTTQEILNHFSLPIDPKTITLSTNSIWKEQIPHKVAFFVIYDNEENGVMYVTHEQIKSFF